MKISIITICYNRRATIEKCIQGILEQDYDNIEYIIIDGASTDGTQEIISSYSNRIHTYISEPDGGMYEAINKGLALATGDVIGLMHSDDEFYDQGVVSRIAKAFKENTHTDAIYADGIMVSNDEKENLIRDRVGSEFSIKKIRNGWLPLHPTFYMKRELFEKHGYYNVNYKIASDTDFFLRYLYKHRINAKYIPTYMIKMRMGGLSTSSGRIFEVLKEDYKIYKEHNLSPLRAVFLKKGQTLLEYIRH